MIKRQELHTEATKENFAEDHVHYRLEGTPVTITLTNPHDSSAFISMTVKGLQHPEGEAAGADPRLLPAVERFAAELGRDFKDIHLRTGLIKKTPLAVHMLKPISTHPDEQFYEIALRWDGPQLKNAQKPQTEMFKRVDDVIMRHAFDLQRDVEQALATPLTHYQPGQLAGKVVAERQEQPALAGPRK